MNVIDTPLPGVKILIAPKFEDERGFFSEVWSEKTFASGGFDLNFVQDNHSHSKNTGTVRGLHYQSPPFEQAKLVRVSRGSVFDVAVDFRAGSPTYGQWFGTELSVGNWKQLFIPAGFLHGFVTREPDTEVQYKCSAPYAPEHDGGIRFDDETLAIDWGIIPGSESLSKKDASAPSFASVQSPFVYCN